MAYASSVFHYNGTVYQVVESNKEKYIRLYNEMLREKFEEKGKLPELEKKLKKMCSPATNPWIFLAQAASLLAGEEKFFLEEVDDVSLFSITKGPVRH